MIIVKIIYNDKFAPGCVDVLKTILPFVAEALWPSEYAFENLQVIDEGYSYYRMEDVVYISGEPNMGQRFIGEKFIFPDDNSRQYRIEYYAFDRHQNVIDGLTNALDRMTLF